MKPALYMFYSAIFFAGMGTAIKLLGHLPFYELVFFRSAIIFGICVPRIARLKERLFGKKENRKILLMRGIFGTAGLTLYFWTLQNLDFGTAVTIQYTSPIFTTLIAARLAGTKNSMQSFALMLIALLGVASIYRFDFSGIDTKYAALGILAAFFSGCAYNCISLLKDRENPHVIMLFFPLVTMPLVAIPSAFHFVLPSSHDLPLVGAMGVSTYLAQYFLTKAYQIGPATKIAIFGNLNVIMALAIGTFFFQETLDSFKIVGAALILASVLLSQYAKPRTEQGMSKKQTA